MRDGYRLWLQHLEGWGRGITTDLRSAWSTHWFPGQPELQCVDLTNKINNRSWRDGAELRASTVLAGYLKCIPRTQVGKEARPPNVSGKSIRADGLRGTRTVKQECAWHVQGQIRRHQGWGWGWRLGTFIEERMPSVDWHGKFWIEQQCAPPMFQ